MNNFKVMNLLLLTSFILNASEIVTMNDKNISQSRKDDAFHFALELGAKGDIWNPGLSKDEAGKSFLDYDTEGLYLGYGVLKGKLYNTDIFTVEKFKTLQSTDNQTALLEEYKRDKKTKTSIDGYRASLHFMKVFNHLTGKNILNGLEYKYNTKNFIGDATLKTNAIYWYGNSVDTFDPKDYTEYSKGDVLSFKTKFEEHQLVNHWEVSDENSTRSFYIGYFNLKWSKPAYLTIVTPDRVKPIIFGTKYENEGVVVGYKYETKVTGWNVDIYGKWGTNGKVIVSNDVTLEDFKMIDKNDDVTMNSLGIKLAYKVSNIYSNNRMNVNWIIGGEGYKSWIDADINGFLGKKSRELDQEVLYRVQTALEFTF